MNSHRYRSQADICRRNCAFVNFTNISNAIKAIDGIKNKPEYANLRIAHGKDRCANPPRSGPQGASGQRRSNGQHSPNIMDGTEDIEIPDMLGDDVQDIPNSVPEIKHEMHVDPEGTA